MRQICRAAQRDRFKAKSQYRSMPYQVWGKNNAWHIIKESGALSHSDSCTPFWSILKGLKSNPSCASFFSIIKHWLKSLLVFKGPSKVQWAILRILLLFGLNRVGQFVEFLIRGCKLSWIVCITKINLLITGPIKIEFDLENKAHL